MIELFIGLVLVTFVLAINRYLPGQCNGNCEQGRKPCDCDRGKWEK